jgi:hypothetical protein
LTIKSIFDKFIPAFNALNDDAWITGPSAIGSENGIPNSIKSAPFLGSSFNIL